MVFASFCHFCHKVFATGFFRSGKNFPTLKLLEHAIKVLERVIEGRVRKIVKIDDMQFGFMAAGRSTTDAIFIVRQLPEKYLARNKELWMAFVDLEKEKHTRGGISA